VSPTGEFPAAPAAITAEHALDASTPIRTGLVITLLVVSFGVGAAHYRQQTADQRQEDLARAYAEHLKDEAKARELSVEQRLADQLRLQRIEDGMERTARASERMERKLDALTEGGVRTVRGQMR
jgi:hypothetical protein